MVVKFGVAVGLNDDFYKEAIEEGASIIVIDVANGYLENVIQFTCEIANYIKRFSYSNLFINVWYSSNISRCIKI